jgi:tRNA(fMet)-specific endonuclease VapC
VTYLFDTDHVSILQRGGTDSLPLLKRFRDIGPDDYGTTIVTYEEQCRGWADLIRRAQTPETRVESYAQLQNNLRFFSAIAVVEYNAAADALVVTWERAKVRSGTKDLRIAAVTVVNGATLLTRNTRDFGKVPGLRFEDWTT